MEEMCPRCHEQKVTKSNTGNVARHAGLVGMLIANSAASYSCLSCGKIPLSEFSDDFQSAVKRKRIFSVLGAVAIFVAVVVFLFAMELR